MRPKYMLDNQTFLQGVAMSISMLYHAFGVSGVKYLATDYSGSKVTFHAEMTHHTNSKKYSEKSMILLVHNSPIMWAILKITRRIKHLLAT